jgi:hypothetical protein
MEKFTPLFLPFSVEVDREIIRKHEDKEYRIRKLYHRMKQLEWVLNNKDVHPARALELEQKIYLMKKCLYNIYSLRRNRKERYRRALENVNTWNHYWHVDKARLRWLYYKQYGLYGDSKADALKA